MSLLMGELDIKLVMHEETISPFKKRIEHEYYFLVKDMFYLSFLVFEEDGKEDIHEEWHFYNEFIDSYRFPKDFILYGQGCFDMAIKAISEYFGIPYKIVFLEDLLDKYGMERGPMI